jgi:ABC-type glutathione transport system ATPase component
VTAAVVVRDLTRKFRGRPAPALAGVSFEVERGEVLGIVGPSGCGKSTLARLIVALDRPTSGKVALLGSDPFRLSGAELRRLRRRFQLVFQDPLGSADPRWTARRSMQEALALRPPAPGPPSAGTDWQRLLDLVQLDANILDRRPHALSGGERQRIALARALAVDPDLLILDESLSALDTVTRRAVLDRLLAWRKSRGATLVLITHDLRLVAAVADRALVLENGRVVRLGPARDVLRS